MATLKLCQHALRVKQIQTRTYYLSCKLRKKQYEYDLDSLVNWKKETKLLFGPQRKLTKTGKLKKRTKALDQQIQENVEILSSMSNSDSIVDTNSNVPSRITSTSDPLGSELLSAHLLQSKSFTLGHKEANFHTELSFCDENSSTVQMRLVKTPSGSSNESKGKNTRWKNSNISTSQQKLEQALNSDRDDTSSANCSNTKNSSMYSEQVRPVDTQEYREHGKDNEVIDIPKIEPVPSSKHVSADKKVFLPKMGEPPIEPPSSFNIISKFPLVPQGCKASQNDVEAEQLHSFKMDVESMALRVLPSVKTVLNKTMSDLNRFFLNRWREGMINELGEQGFQKYKNDTMRQGINLHANIMEYLSGKEENELQIMPENEGHWTSVHTALELVSDIRALEMDILHPALCYKGVFDCVACYKDLLCVIDWKVSKKPRPLLKNTYDDPLQIAAYVGAVNATEHYVKQHGEINHGLIVVAYPDGSPAHMHMMNRDQVEQYWQDWTARLLSFYTLTYTEKIGAKQQAQATSKT